MYGTLCWRYAPAVTMGAPGVGAVTLLDCPPTESGRSTEEPVVDVADHAPRVACNGGKSSQDMDSVVVVAFRVSSDANARPQEALTSQAAYRYQGSFRSRAPPPVP